MESNNLCTKDISKNFLRVVEMKYFFFGGGRFFLVGGIFFWRGYAYRKCKDAMYIFVFYTYDANMLIYCYMNSMYCISLNYVYAANLIIKFRLKKIKFISFLDLYIYIRE